MSLVLGGSILKQSVFTTLKRQNLDANSLVQPTKEDGKSACADVEWPALTVDDCSHDRSRSLPCKSYTLLAF